MREITLTRGYVALVDDDDFERVNQYTWHAQLDRRKSDGAIRTVYARRSIHKANGAWKAQGMHVFIMGVKGPDHIDGNGLNNQKYNLRPATAKQNHRSRALNINNTSGYKGVTWSKKTKKWIAQVRAHGKTFNLGHFANILDAAKAHDAAAIEHFGPFALTNAMLKERAQTACPRNVERTFSITAKPVVTIAGMREVLEDYGFVIGERDPRLSTDYSGKYMVAESYDEDELPTRDGSNGPWCVVGDNLDELIKDAYENSYEFEGDEGLKGKRRKRED